MAVVVHVVGTYDGKQLGKAQRDLDNLKRSVEGSSSAYAKAGGGAAGFAAQMDSSGGKIAGVGKKLSLGVSLPLAAIGYSGVKSAADFQTTMASMQVNSGATGAKMEELRGLAMKLGADTVFSAGEAADAMLALSKGGMSTASIQGGALAATMNLAATEGMDLSSAATIMTQSMNTFGIKADAAAKVTDLLAAGAVASTAGVQDLADGMKYVGSTAASLHLPMNDTVTALAAMNNAGIDSTTAGTSLNRMLLGLAAPSKNAGKAFEKFGVATTDANGQILDMQGMIAELQDKLGGLSDSDRNEALKQMFGVEGMRAANVLMKGGVKGWKDLSAAVDKAGVAQEMADARMTGMAGAMERARGSAETAGLAIGKALAPAVVLVSGKVEELANWFTNLDPHTQTAIVSVAAVAAAMGPLAWGAGKVMQSFKVMVAPIGAAAKGLKAAHQGLSLARQGFRDAQVAQSAFSGPMGTIGGKLRTLTTAIGSGTKALAKQTVAVAKTGAAWLVSTARQVAAKGAQLAVAAAAKVAAAGQWLLNAALTANPIGLVIAALVALGVGLVLLWKKSDKFRAGVTKVFSAIAVGVLGLVKVWLHGLKFMSGLFLSVVGVIVKGAAKAFGWVPGVGPKLKKAAAGFEDFKKGVQTKLDKAIDKVDEWQTSVKNMPKKVELKGKIDDLKAKIDDAKARLRDKNLTEPEKAKIRAQIDDLKDKVKAAKKELSGIKDPKPVTVAVNFKIKGRTYEIPGSGTYDAFTGKRIKGPGGGGLGGLTPRSKVDDPSRGSGHSSGLMSATHGAGHAGAKFGARGKMWSWHRGSDGLGVHNGADISAPSGTSVFASRSGTILHSGFGGPEGGWAGRNVIEQLRSGVKLVYAHLSSSTGASRVSAGGRIGRVGSTGNSSGPHLHISAIKGGTYVNPIPHLAVGGLVRGPGTGTSDSIPAMLSNHEWVSRAATVRRLGPRFFAALDDGWVPAVGVPSSRGRGSSVSIAPGAVQIHVDARGLDPAAVRQVVDAAVDKAMQKLLREVMAA